MRAERLELGSGTSRRRCATLAQRIRALASAPPELRRRGARDPGGGLRRGDEAVLELTRRFDSPTRRGRAARAAGDGSSRRSTELDPAVRAGLELAVGQRAARCARPSLGATCPSSCRRGSACELREVPVGRAGAYVPGGRAAYPSSAVMCCVPAQGRRRRAGRGRDAARPRRRAGPDRARGLRALRRRRGLPDGRRAGDRGAGLRHRDASSRST